VKLWQFEPEDRYQAAVSIENKNASSRQTLFENPHEKVFCITLAANEVFVVEKHMGLEVLILAGEACLQEDINKQDVIDKSTQTQESQASTHLEQYTWLRQPIGKSIKLTAKTQVKLWIKQDHLVGVDKQIERVNAIANA
jgi:hypothetical protein